MYNKNRKAFTMIMAIFLLLSVSLITAVMISLTTSTTKQGSDNYLSEQAKLLAISATEYSILAISAHDRTTGNGCINSINAQYPNAANPLFDINVSIRYIGLGGIANCNSYIDTISTPESTGAFLLDVIIRSNDNLGQSEPIVYHKRTLQKP